MSYPKTYRYIISLVNKPSVRGIIEAGTIVEAAEKLRKTYPIEVRNGMKIEEL